MEQSKNLTKTTAIKGLAAKLGITNVKAKETYEAVVGLMGETLAAGGDVRIPGVGRIYKATLAARTYRIPGTNETVSKPERTKFKIASKTI